MAKKKNVKKGKKKSKKKKSKRKKRGGSLLVFIITIVIIIGVIAVSKLKRGELTKYIKADKVAEFGRSGEGPGQINAPRGIAVSPDGHVYVADLGNARVDKFTLDGQFVAMWGKKGKAAGEFNEPSGVAVDRENNVYVADSWNGRIQKFNSRGKYELEIGGEKAGFYSPRNCAVNKYGILYVADTGTSRVHKFDTAGNRLGNPIGGRGKSIDKFEEVFGLAFDTKSRVFIGDPGNARVVVMTSDLQPVATIAVKGWQEAKPMWPMLAVDSRDYLYAMSSGTQEIYVFDTKTDKFKYVGTIKTDEKEKNLLSSPLGLAIDQQDNIYVSETGKNSIVKIRPVFN